MNIKGLLLFFKEFNFPLCQRTLLTELHVLFLFERHFFDWISFSLWAEFTILGERNQHLKRVNMKRLQTFAKPQNLSNDKCNKKELSDTGVPGKEPLSKGVACDKD